MYCGNCGHKLKEGALFCGNCGTKIPKIEGENPKEFGAKEEAGDQAVQEPSGNVEGTPSCEAEEASIAFQEFEELDTQESFGGGKKKGKRGKGLLVAVLLLLCLLIAGGAGYGTIGLSMAKEKEAKKIRKAGIPEYQKEEEEIAEDWKELKITDLSEKREAVKKLKKIVGKIKEFDGCKKEIQALEKEKEKYDLDENSYHKYESLIKKCQASIKDKEAEQAVESYEDAKDALEDLKKANDIYIKDRVKMYKKVDLKDAEKSVVSEYKTTLEKIQNMQKKSPTDYVEFKKIFKKMDETVFLYIPSKNDLQISVQQVDASAFPKVRLYLSVKDDKTGKVPEKLEKSLFYINKEDANAAFVKQAVLDAGQLNKNEALKVDMVADVSGSMDGKPIEEAKNIMSGFVKGMQFDTGDQVELTSFSNGVRLEEEFTSDAAKLSEKIQLLKTGNNTSLYDALYTAVERVAAQNGARCVIAFTDGQDNNSNCTKEDVVELAKRYHIPVFIIGIGNSDYSSVASIATETGGAYYNSAEVSMMKSIYEEIYEAEKELYVLEYEDASGATLTDTSNIQVGYKSLEYGGECKYSYVPNTLLQVKANALYEDGPEAVVEKYMKNFADAMTTGDFSKIEPYLLYGTPIHQAQKSYVQQKIAEKLDSYEIIGTEYKDQNNCIVTTRETYYVQLPDSPLQLMTQKCRYVLVLTGRGWHMTDFDGKVEVLSRIHQ